MRMLDFVGYSPGNLRQWYLMGKHAIDFLHGARGRFSMVCLAFADHWEMYRAFSAALI